MKPRVIRARRAPEAAPSMPPASEQVDYSMVYACQSDESLVGDILNQVRRMPQQLRAGGHLHVSDLLSKCIRKRTLSEMHNVPVRPKRLSISDRITFAIGDAVHDTVKMMAAEGAPRAVWGKWSCSCGHIYHDTPCLQSETDPNDICELCFTPTTKYHEVSVFDDDYMIVGNPDLLLYLASLDAMHVTEIKSMAHDQWKELTRPLPEHVLQVVFYWFLMHRNGYKLTDRVSVVYITKGYQFGAKEVYKEFIIDPVQEVHRLDPYLTDALAYKHAKASGTVPERKECQSEYTVKAKKCEVCQTCFAMA